MLKQLPILFSHESLPPNYSLIYRFVATGTLHASYTPRLAPLAGHLSGDHRRAEPGRARRCRGGAARAPPAPSPPPLSTHPRLLGAPLDGLPPFSPAGRPEEVTPRRRAVVAEAAAMSRGSGAVARLMALLVSPGHDGGVPFQPSGARAGGCDRGYGGNSGGDRPRCRGGSGRALPVGAAQPARRLSRVPETRFVLLGEGDPREEGKGEEPRGKEAGGFCRGSRRERRAARSSCCCRLFDQSVCVSCLTRVKGSCPEATISITYWKSAFP